MKLTFVGVGEAFDPQLGNASYLIEASSTILIDCGYAIPRNFFALEHPAESLDAVYLTHFHADHTFGLPALLYRLAQDGRTTPLSVIGQPGTETFVHKTFQLAYPGAIETLPYALEFIESAEQADVGALSLHFAETNHPVRNFAVRVSDGKTTIGVSGDGELTDASRELFRSCDLLVHEAFGLDVDYPGHTSAQAVATFAAQCSQLKTLALVHISRQHREAVLAARQTLSQTAGCEVIVPEPGVCWNPG